MGKWDQSELGSDPLFHYFLVVADLARVLDSARAAMLPVSGQSVTLFGTRLDLSAL